MYSVHIAYIAHRAYILYIRVAQYAFLFTLAGPTHFARISKITTRQIRNVNVVNSDNVGMSTVVHFKHYIFNILPSDNRSVLKLYRKFEKSCIMVWYNFRNN